MKIIFEEPDEKEAILYALQSNGYTLTQRNLDIVIRSLPNIDLLTEEFEVYMQDSGLRELEENEEFFETPLDEQYQALQEAALTLKFPTY